MDRGKIIYEEEKTSRFIIGIFLLISAFFIFAFICQSVLKLGPIGDNPAPSWFYLAFTAFLVICMWIFKTLKIKNTEDEIVLSFNGFFEQRIKFDDIEKVAIDDKFCAGSRLKIGFAKGKFRIIYNVGQPRVVVSIKNKRKAIVFSTNNPEEAIQIITAKTK
jgi:hypothetical protein